MNRKSDFNEFPAWVCWLAQDADGVWWGYEVEPNMSHNGWYENEVGRSVKLIPREPALLNGSGWQSSVRKINSGSGQRSPG